MSKDDYLKFSVKLLEKFSEGRTDFIATIMGAEAEKDYDTVVKYLKDMMSSIEYLIERLEE